MSKALESNLQALYSAVQRDWRLLIDGDLVPAATSETMPINATFDGSHLADVPLASVTDVERAVAAARTAFPAWRRTTLTERAELLRQFGRALQERAHILGLLDAATVGNPITPMVADVKFALMMLEYQCGVAFAVKGDSLPSMTGSWLMTRREPYGVVGRIIAYNHPLLFAAMKIGPPLLMGNTLVLKLSDQSPLSALYVAELVQEIFPPGVVNILSGTGAVTGDALVRHPDVKRLALIGSVETGRMVQGAASTGGVKHVSLELGGKNPFIVCPDADLDGAVQAAAAGMNCQFQGQSCGSTSRLFLHEDIHDQFLEQLALRLRSTRIGHPLDPSTEMGCLVSQRHLDRILAEIGRAKEEGGRLLTGGSRPSGPEFATGPYLAPTVLTEIDMTMQIAQTELFGPVLSVLRWKDIDRVVSQANSVRYGLTGAVWTNDLKTALSLADQLDVGYVWINGSSSHFLGAPFSGHKDSGTDSEESIDELVSYTQIKTIDIPISVS